MRYAVKKSIAVRWPSRRCSAPFHIIISIEIVAEKLAEVESYDRKLRQIFEEGDAYMKTAWYRLPQFSSWATCPSGVHEKSRFPL